MADVIKLLPDYVANQIAAGEVIQRPASVLKELVENSIDAGSTSIKINIKDAGKTLIQVIDNGCGLTATDARMAFERHATSKIEDANDLFSIKTMGFRGEALASIAAVAHVELKTRTDNDELGTCISISGTEIISQETISCSPGCNFTVKNLFYNIPARRKFLKANSTELRNILIEFNRIALANPNIELSLIHNDTEMYNLPKSNTRQRIINLVGKNVNNKIVDINTETTSVKIWGFVGKPKYAKKSYNDQYFFVNNRFMKHPYFHKAVISAYDKIIQSDTVPSYFIFFDVDPSIIDINIHPTKTEIKFEDEKFVYQLIHAAIRESLGKYNIVPSIDFEEDRSLEIPAKPVGEISVEKPTVEVNTNYNPFDDSASGFNPFNSDSFYNPFESGEKIDDNKFYQEFKSTKPSTNNYSQPVEKDKNWETLYTGVDNTQDFNNETFSEQGVLTTVDNIVEVEPEQTVIQQAVSDKSHVSITNNFFQIRNKYIMTNVRSGLMIVNQKRAHERILFEQFLKRIDNNHFVTQQTLFPVTIELNASDYTLLQIILDDIIALGFDIKECGLKTFVINGVPAEMVNSDPEKIIMDLLNEYKESQLDIKQKVRENLAKSLAIAASVSYRRALVEEEMSDLIDKLFACETPNYSPDGKLIVSIIDETEMDKRFL